MKRWLLLAIFSVSAIMTIAVTSHARQAAQARGGDRPTTDRSDDRGDRINDRGGPMGDHDHDDFGGPGGHDGGPFGGMGGDREMRGGFGGRRPPPTMDVMRNYVDLVTKYTELSRDTTTAGVSAAVTANDILRTKGNAAAIEYFEKLVPEIKDQAVNRAVRFQLIELYKATSQNDKALEQLRLIMVTPEKTDLHGPTTQP